MNAAQLTLLELAAQAAIGRREAHCQVAMADIYKAAGLMPATVDIPSGSRDWARAQGRELIAPWVDGSGLFEQITTIEPGALLGFRLGHTLHHVAIALSGGRMVHVAGDHGIQIAACIPAPWAQRMERIWRFKA
jgi:cell wall-associated NlpC family hydrolase